MAEQTNDPLQQTDGLHPFAGNPRRDMPNGLPFKLTDYLELVDWTGRILRDDRRGAIPESTPKILQQSNIDSKQSTWHNLSGTAILIDHLGQSPLSIIPIKDAYQFTTVPLT